MSVTTDMPRSCIPDPRHYRQEGGVSLSWLPHLWAPDCRWRYLCAKFAKVQDGKPMDLTLSLHFKIGIPAGGPTYVTSLPRHGVAEHDLIELIQIKGRRLIGTIRRPVFRGRGTRFNLKARHCGKPTRIPLVNLSSEPVWRYLGGWQVVYNPNSPNTRPQSCCEICPSLLFSRSSACKATRRASIPTYWSCRETSQWGRPASAPQDFRHSWFGTSLRLAKRPVVVAIWQLSLSWSQLVYHHLHRVVHIIFNRGEPWQVESFYRRKCPCTEPNSISPWRLGPQCQAALPPHELQGLAPNDPPLEPKWNMSYPCHLSDGTSPAHPYTTFKLPYRIGAILRPKADFFKLPAV